jgi:type IV pilus assembly protein PilC
MNNNSIQRISFMKWVLSIVNIKYIHKKIHPKFLTLFFEELSMLLSSGVLISDALLCLSLRFPDKNAKSIITTIYKEVYNSKCSISQAFSQHPKTFIPSIIAVIEAGEQGGSNLLAMRFKDLSERIEYEQLLNTQLKRAAAYPLFVLSLSLGLYGLLLEVVFPRLSDLLSSLGSDLPPMAKGVIFLASILKRLWPILIALVFTFPLALYFSRKYTLLKKIIDSYLLKIPILGDVYISTKAALVCRVFRSLYLCNQPTPQSIDLCIKLMTNESLKDGLIKARFEITNKGEMLSSALSKSGLFSPMACLALEVGERTGKIAPALEKVSDYLAKNAKDRLDVAIAVINPLLTLIVIGGAGIILISFFQATYQIIYATQ